MPAWLRGRRSSADRRLSADRRTEGPGGAAEAAVRRTLATHGVGGPALRVLRQADVNGPDAHPVWTFLKAAYGDTSDIGWNFGKFIVARDGNVVGRYCPPLRPALLTAAIEKMLAQKPLTHPLAALPGGAEAAALKAKPPPPLISAAAAAAAAIDAAAAEAAQEPPTPNATAAALATATT